MLGMPPTVLGNFVGVLKKWIAGRDLWDWQQALKAADADALDAGAAAADGTAAGAGPAAATAAAAGHATATAAAAGDTAAVSTAESRALAVLRRPLLQTMRCGPVPYAVWRTAAAPGCLGKTGVTPGQRIVVGLGTAVKADNADPMLMFGGQRHGEDETVHACCGYKMAIGILVGTTAALLRSGTLRPDGPYSLRVG